MVWAETDYPLPCATLFSNFSTAKKLQKPFAAQTPPRKRGYVEDFALKSVNAHRNHLRLRNCKNSRFALSTKLCCEIAARQARGYGVLYKVKPIRHKCYFLYNHAVNRARFSAQLAYGKMTLLNFSFLFRRCKVKFWCCFIVAKGFHFPKHPFVLNFHSLLTHLFTS